MLILDGANDELVWMRKQTPKIRATWNSITCHPRRTISRIKMIRTLVNILTYVGFYNETNMVVKHLFLFKSYFVSTGC